MTFVSNGSMAKGDFTVLYALKRISRRMEVETIRRLIYEVNKVKKVKIEDVLFEECNNLLRQIREELYDLRKECDDRVHILLLNDAVGIVFHKAQAGVGHVKGGAVERRIDDLKVIIFIFRANLADD